MSEEKREQPTTEVPAPPSSLVPNKSVLVVDDDELLARALQRVLTVAGFEVVIANDGNAAVQTIMTRVFDVILTDIHMPGMSGVDLLSVVRAYDLDVPVILMTGEPTIETAIEAVSLGALQYLPKPTPNDVLVKAVERAWRLRKIAATKREALRLAGDGAAAPGDRTGLATSLDRALESMWIAFQPLVDARTQRVVAYEALMRTREAALPHPGAVLAAAERLDRLDDVGRRVRSLAAQAFERAPADVDLFVNLHAKDLADPMLFDANLPLTKMAERVVLEITERAAMEDVKDVQARVSVLRFNGFRLAIDDLGAGYAGLSSFAALEPEIVKLDMSLVRGVHESEVRRRLVRTMTSLCRELGIQVVAEGVEAVTERDVLRELGCDMLQGYLYAKPGPPFPPAAQIP